MKNLVSILCLSISLAGGVYAQAPLNQNFPDPATRSIPMGKRDGFFVQGNKVYIVRAGVTTLVEREMLFPNGIRVLPNGTVTLRDGRETTLLPRQWLTFEGSIDEIPVVVEPVPAPPTVVRETVVRESAVKESGVSARDGVTVSGADVFITRNGSTEKVTSSLKMPNGVVVHPDGTVVLGNGKKITLSTEQVLDLHGVLHEAPVRPNPAAGVNPSVINTPQ